jgi:hypothetical protein
MELAVSGMSQFNSAHIEARSPFDKNRLRVFSVLVPKCSVPRFIASPDGVHLAPRFLSRYLQFLLDLKIAIAPTKIPANRKNRSAISSARYQLVPQGQPPGRNRLSGIVTRKTKPTTIRLAAMMGKVLGRGFDVPLPLMDRFTFPTYQDCETLGIGRGVYFFGSTTN